MIHVLADQNLYKATEYLPAETHLTLYDPADGLPSLKGFDAVIVQTVTKLNASTLPQIPAQLKFIGTGSSGTDHIDKRFYESKGVSIVSAKGCNARAVGEYVMTGILLWMHARKVKNKARVGVIGAGNAGRAVLDLLQRFNIEFLAYDPPRAETEADFHSAPLKEVLKCNILTFHVPLSVDGEHSTYHWLNEEALKTHSYDLIINASRGGVVDENALFNYWKKGTVADYILDVWENEPQLNSELAENAFIATPHIAGYSEQAKINATSIVYTALADFFNLPYHKGIYDHIQKRIDLQEDQNDFHSIITHLHPIMDYDRKLRAFIHAKDRAQKFSRLRNDFPFRYEYPFLEIQNEKLKLFDELQKLGIRGY